jgi:hypothetical protein
LPSFAAWRRSNRTEKRWPRCKAPCERPQAAAARKRRGGACHSDRRTQKRRTACLLVAIPEIVARQRAKWEATWRQPPKSPAVSYHDDTHEPLCGNAGFVPRGGGRGAIPGSGVN